MVSLALIGRGVVDGLANFVSGIGTGKDKASQYVYTYTPLDQRTIEAAYATDWLARKIIDVLPQDMTREWRVWQWDKASDCYELEKTLKVRTKVRRALKLARLYGGSAILIGDGSDRPEKPLDVERIGKGDLKYLHVFSRHQLSNDRERVKELKNADYGLPEFYRIAAQGYSSGRRDLDQIVVHRSRFVFFEGAEPPDSIRDQNSGWGLPLYQSILEAVTAANAAAKNAASLVEEAKLDIITMPDLGSVLATDEGAKRLTERFTLANVLKSTVNTLLLGEGETFERKQISFAGLVDLMNANMQIASGAADVPITRLLGQSPAGLNATGESDLRNYYDHVRSLQTTDLSESLDTLDEALIRSVAGRRPDEAMYEWESLRQETDEEKARNALVKAQTTQIYLNLGLFTDQELRPAVADQLIEDGIYPTLDQYLLSDEEREQADLEEHQADIDKQQKQLEMQTAVAGPPKEAPQLRVVGQDHSPGGHGHNQLTHGREGGGEGVSSKSEKPEVMRFEFLILIPGSPKTDDVVSAALDHLDARLPPEISDEVKFVKQPKFENDHIKPGFEQWRIFCEGPLSAADLANLTSSKEEARSQDHSPFEASDVWSEDHTPGGHEHDQKTHGHGHGEGETEDDPIKAAVRKHVLRVADKMGFNREKIVFYDEPISMVVNGKAMRLKAGYDDKQDKIVVSLDAMTGGEAAGVMAHEITHHKFESVRKAREKDSENPDFAEVKAAWGPAIREARETGGPTSYSAEYWQAYKDLANTTDRISIHHALDETVAEVARLVENGMTVKTPQALKLYEAINAAYDRSASK